MSNSFMKQIVTLFFISILCCYGCGNHDGNYHFSLSGNITGIKYGKAFLKSDQDSVLYAVDIEGGKFELEGELSEPGRYILQINRHVCRFFMDGKKMSINCPYEEIRSDSIKGSPANDLEQVYDEFLNREIGQRKADLLKMYTNVSGKSQERADSVMTAILDLERETCDLTLEFIKKYPDNIFSAYIANVVKDNSYEQGEKMYGLLSEAVKKSYWGCELKRNIDVLSASALGIVCQDFKVKDGDGKILSLSSFKGKILILDFWASWCGPCRQEMKNLRRQYEEFKSKGVQIISISLDDSWEKWRKACDEEQIPWISTWDDKGWKNSEIRKIFGIQSIPFIVLLDKEGHIVAKNIRRNTLREGILKLLNQNK